MWWYEPVLPPRSLILLDTSHYHHPHDSNIVRWSIVKYFKFHQLRSMSCRCKDLNRWSDNKSHGRQTKNATKAIWHFNQSVCVGGEGSFHEDGLYWRPLHFSRLPFDFMVIQDYNFICQLYYHPHKKIPSPHLTHDLMVGCLAALKCLVSFLSVDESQRPRCLYVKHSHKCTVWAYF